MKKSDLKFLLLAIFIAVAAACSNSSSSSQGEVITYTTIDMASNININDYRKVTAKKIVYDTVMVVTIDSSATSVKKEKRKVRDSVYLIWWQVPALDSARKNRIPNSTNTGDSMVYDFVPIDRELVLKDYMKNWPVKN